MQVWVETAGRAVPAVDLLWEGIRRFRLRNGSVLTGFVAYRLFLWAVPLVVVMIGLLGFSSASEAFNVVGYLTEYGADDDTASELVGDAESSGFVLFMSGMVALAWTTRGLIRGLHYVFAQAAGLRIEARAGVVREVMLALPGAMMATVVLLGLSLIQRWGPLLTLSGLVAALAFNVALLWFVARTMPRRSQHWYDLLPGAVVAAAGLSGVQVFLSVYLPERVQSASSLYGSMGAAIAALFSMFLFASLLVAIPFVNDLWVDRHEVLAGRPWILDPEVLPRWLRRPARWVARRERDTGT